jgi:hypothetical protein
MTKIQNQHASWLARGLLGAVLFQIAIAPAASSQTMKRSYTVSPQVSSRAINTH